MAEFTPINTQEEFDQAIQQRLNRQERSIRAEYADYATLKDANGKYDAQIAKLNQDLADANAKIKKSEMDSLKAKIAAEKGLPAEIQDRLSGETEDDLRKDAENLAKIFKAEQRRDLPGKNHERELGDAKDAAYRDFLKNLRGE